MNGFLDRMVHSSLGMREKLMPRVPSVFEPQGLRARMFGEEESPESKQHEETMESGFTDKESTIRSSDYVESNEHRLQETPTVVANFSPIDMRKDKEANRKTTWRGDLPEDKGIVGEENTEKLKRRLSNPLNPDEEYKSSDFPKEALGIQDKEISLTPQFRLNGKGNDRLEKTPKNPGENALADSLPKQADQRQNLQGESFFPAGQPTFWNVLNPHKAAYQPTQARHQDPSEQRSGDSPSSSWPEPKGFAKVSETRIEKSRKGDVKGSEAHQEAISNALRLSRKNTDGLHKDMQAMKAALSGLKSAMHGKPSATESTIHVSIGRVEVKAVPEKFSSGKMTRSKAAVMPLQDYLAYRAQGKIG